MVKKEKRIIFAAVVFVLIFGTGTTVSAMHIMEGYLPPGYCIACSFHFFCFSVPH